MKIHWTIGGVRIRASLERMVRVRGVTSDLGNGKHILMWDFDDTTGDVVRRQLKDVQVRFHLPHIYVLRSSPGSFHAYSFSETTWPNVIRVIASTHGIDLAYFKIAVWRGYFTLRINEAATKPELDHGFVVWGEWEGDVNPERMGQFVDYWTGG